MLNIRINLQVDVKKAVIVVFTACLVTAQLISLQTSQAVERAAHFSQRSYKMLAPKEMPVTVDLTYLTVTTTRVQAKKALASSYAKYFDPQTLAFFTAYANGLPMAQWKCLNKLWTNESHFNPKAVNKNSRAYGIAQFLPTTWGNYNLTKTSAALLQVKYGLHYIQVRYGTPCGAWSFWKAHYWY